MADVTAPQFQEDVNDFADIVNKDENTTVTTRLGQQTNSVAKTIKGINDRASAAIITAANNFNLSPSGFDFATGGTLTSNNQTVSDAIGNEWIYTLEIPEGGYIVTAGTTPTDPPYKQVSYNQASNISDSQGSNVQSYINNNLTPFKTVADMLAYDYTEIPADSRIEWQGYYTQSDGGGNLGVLKKGDSTSLIDDGGSVFIIVNDVVNGVWIETNKATSKIEVKKFGIKGYPNDDTAQLRNLSKYVASGNVVDFNGLTVRIVHDGNNSNPFKTGGEPNRTSYCFIEKANHVKFQNGVLICDNLDMTENSLVAIGFAGCKNPEFDNFHMIVQASGIPSYDANGYETFASLITMEHHEDGTLSRGLTVKPNCSFKINHPNGGSIGAQESNPVHNYSGKLVGIEARGNTSLGDDFIITDTNITGAYFFECTARTIWVWHSERNTIDKNKFYRCGLNDTEFCNYGIRVTHYGSNSSYDGNMFEKCHMTSAGILVSNNNSPRTPVNYSVNGNKAKNCTRFDIGFNAGVNAECNFNQFKDVIASFAHIRFIEQANSEWGEFQVKGNMGNNVSVLNPATEGTGFIYNSANNPLMLDIDNITVDGCDARAAITLRFHPQKVKRSKIKNCTDYGIYYGTGIVGMEFDDNEIEDCPNDWGIGGFSDSQAIYNRNKIKRCFKGLRAGNGSEVYGGKIEDCTETHLEIRNSIAKGVSIEDGPNTSSLQTALLVQGAGSELIAECLIRNNGAFARGIDSQIPSLIVNNGVFGSYSTGAINGSSVTKLNNYNESGAII